MLSTCASTLQVCSSFCLDMLDLVDLGRHAFIPVIRTSHACLLLLHAGPRSCSYSITSASAGLPGLQGGPQLTFLSRVLCWRAHAA